MAAKFFEDDKGNKSSSRLMAFIVIIVSIIFAQEILIFSMITNINIVLSATAMGTTFITMAGPAMFFLFNQKKTEQSIPPTPTPTPDDPNQPII